MDPEDRGIIRTCNDPNCNVGKDGLCLDGWIPLSECPRFSERLDNIDLPEDEVAGTSEVVEAFPKPSEFMHCAHGMELSVSECEAVIQDHQSNIVVIFGPADSGKTTMITGFYELFLRGEWEKYAFAGSKTFLAFERRAHNARLSSNRKSPKTERTTQALPEFLHLKVCRLNDETAKHQSLLLLDISGERTEEIANSHDNIVAFTPLRRADHLAIVVDSKSMTDPRKRNSAKEKALTLMRRVFENGMLPEGSQIQIIFSRWDFVPVDDLKTLGFVKKIEIDFQDEFSVQGHPISFHKVSSLPWHNLDLLDGYGLDGLLDLWLKTSAFYKFPTYRDSFVPIDREYGKFFRQQ